MSDALVGSGGSLWRESLAALECPWGELRVLVAGGQGFLGRTIVRALCAAGARHVTIVSRRPGGAPGNCRSLGVDLADRDAAHAALGGERYDLVINASGVIDQSTSRTIYRTLFDVNFFTALYLVQALQDGSVGRFVHLGSNAEYGNASCPHGADTCERPNSAYGVSKLAATKMVVAKALSEGFPACVVRPFLVYGPGQGAGSFLSHAVNAARERREFPTTPGEQTRDFVSVERVAYDVLRVAAAEPFVPGVVYNSCTGVETRVRDVLGYLQARHPGFRPCFGAVPYRKGELMRSRGVPLQPLTEDQARHELFTFLDAEAARPAWPLAG